MTTATVQRIGDVVGRILTQPRPSGQCVVCGKRTDTRFSGHFICNPYDAAGHVVSECKGQAAARLERGLPL